MKPLRVNFISLSRPVIIVFAALFFISGCAAKKPYELTYAEKKLIESKNDSFVVANAPLALNQAEKTYERAEAVWKETRDREKVIPIARLAQEQIDAARLDAGKSAATDLSREMAHNNLLTAKERELQAARADANYYGRLADNYSMEAQTARRQNQVLLSQLKTLTDEQARQRMMVSLNSSLLFETNDSTLTPGGRRELEPLASFLKLHPSSTVIVEGHTDSIGDSGHNQVLSQRRAAAVTDYLATMGVPRSRMIAEGRGEQYPIASNDSEAGRLQNRRVEITISPIA